MPKRYIQVHRTPPPGESIATTDLKEIPLIAIGDVPTAEWQVEDEAGLQKRMSGQQILDLVSGGTPGTGGNGRPAEIEIEDIADGIRIRGKSGDATEFGPWHIVRDGRDGRDGRDATGSTIFDGFQDVYAPDGKVLTLGGKVVSLPVPLRTPTFELKADTRSILLSIMPNVDDPTIGYEYQLRRRNIRNTGWTNPHKWVNLATRLENRVTTYNDFMRLRGGQEYQIRIRSYKLYNKSEPTDYQSVIPLSPMGEIAALGGNVLTVGSKTIVFGT